MNEEIEVLKIIAQRLNKINFAYMVSGSIATNYYTVPRMTRDIDIILELKDVKNLLETVKELDMVYFRRMGEEVRFKRDL